MEFKHLTAKSYLLNLLEEERDPKRVSIDEVQQRNVIRKCIKTFFGGEKNLECLSLVKPFDEDRLRPEFMKSSQELICQIKNKLRLKTIKDKPLTPNMLLNLALEYVDQINRGEVLTILPAFEKIVQIEAKIHTEELFEILRVRIQNETRSDLLPFDE